MKYLKWTAWIVGCLILFIVLAIAALFYSLRSGAITEYGLSQATPYLSPLGIEIDRLERARIDPFHFIRLNNLALRWQDDELGEVAVVLGEAVIEYDGWALLDEQFHLSQFSLSDIQVRAKLTLPVAEQTTEEATDGGVLDPIEALLNSPPLALLTAENIHFKSIALDLDITQGAQRIRYQGQLKRLTSELHWDAIGLTTTVSIDLSSAADEQLQINETLDNTTSLVQLQPSLATTLHGQWQKIDQQWQFKGEFDNTVELTNVLIKQHQGDERLVLETEKITLSLNNQTEGQLDATFTNAFAFSLDAQPIRLNQQFNSSEAQQLHVQPNFSVAGQATITDIDQLIETLSLSATPQLKLNNLSIIQQVGAESQQFSAPQSTFEFNTHLHQGAFSLEGDIALTEIQISDVNAPLSLNNTFKLNTDLDFKKVDLQWDSLLNQQAWIDLQINIDNAARHLQLTHKLTAQIPSSLPQAWRKHEALQSITQQIGSPHVVWTGQTQLTHKATSALDIETDVLINGPLTSQGNIVLTQQRPPTHADGISLAQPLKLAYVLEQNQRYHINLKIDAPSLQTPPLLVPMPLQFELDSQLDWPLTQAKAKGRLQIETKEALSFDLALADFTDHFTLVGKFGLYATPDWQRYVADLASLAPLGEVRSQGHINARFSSAFQPFIDQDVTPEKLLAQAISLTLASTVTQTPELRSELIRLNQPLQLTQQLELAEQQIELSTAFTLADAWLPQGLTIKQLSGQLDVNIPASETPDQVQLKLRLKPATLLFESPDTGVLDVGTLATPLSLDFTAHSKEDEFSVEHFSLSTGDPFLSFNAIAQGDMAGRNGQLESVLSLSFNHTLSQSPKLFIQGDIDLPLQLSFINGQHLSITSEVLLNGLNLSLDTTTIENLNGALSIEEELLWKDDTLSFRYLVPTDPFQRVDYSVVQPYLADQSLRFDSLSQDHIRTGAGLFGFSLKQNLFRLQPFDLDLFGGHISGQLYIDATPNAWQVGLLSRISNIDLRQLLPPDSPLRAEALSPLSARTAFTFDIQQRLMEGQIDITKISRSQLLQLLEIIDPDYQDPQLATVRTALRFAYPKQLHITMHSGLMDMQVTLSALAEPINIRNLPLTPLINHFGAETFSELDAMPLK